MTNHAIRFLTRQVADELAAAARAAVDAWAADWGPQDGLTVDCLPAHELAVDFARGRWSAGGRGDADVWCFEPAGFDLALVQALFPHEFDDSQAADRLGASIAESVARTAISSLAASGLAKLAPEAASLLGRDGEPPAWLWHRYAGTAAVRLTCGNRSLYWFVPGAARPRIKSVPKGVVPLLAALPATSMRVVAELSSIEMRIGDWTSLKVGDVVALGTRIDDPVHLFNDARFHLFDAWPGRQADYRAVELSAPPTSRNRN
jgi:hypothetical protein